MFTIAMSAPAIKGWSSGQKPLTLPPLSVVACSPVFAACGAIRSACQHNMMYPLVHFISTCQLPGLHKSVLQGLSRYKFNLYALAKFAQHIFWKALMLAGASKFGSLFQPVEWTSTCTHTDHAPSVKLLWKLQ